MTTLAPIIYCDYYDQPRRLLVSSGSSSYLIDCPFDKDADEYKGYYLVYSMPEIDLSTFSGEWKSLEQKSQALLGKVAIPKSSFVFSQPRQLDLDILQHIEPV